MFRAYLGIKDSSFALHLNFDQVGILSGSPSVAPRGSSKIIAKLTISHRSATEKVMILALECYK